MTMLPLLLAASAVGATVATGAEQDRAALLAFKNSGDAGSWPMNKLTGWMGDAGPVCGAGRTVKPWSGIACDEGLRVSKVDFVALTHEAHSGEVPPILTHEEGHKLTGDIKHLALLQNLKTLALTSTGATGDVAHFRGHQLKQIFISDTRTGGNMDGVCDQCGEFGHDIYYDDCGSHPCESERLDGTRAGNSDEWCCEPRAEDTDLHGSSHHVGSAAEL